MSIQKNHILIIILTFGVLIFNQIVIQYYLYQKKYDAQTINIAGRQRMLSQRINLETYRLVYNDFAQKPTQKKLISDLFKEWEQNHHALLHGDKKKDIKPVESTEAITKLNSITENINFIGRMIALDTLKAPTLESIYTNQSTFLSKMDQTVFLIEKKASNKLSLIIGIEILFLLLSITMIFLELRFIFLPIIEKLQTQNVALKTQNEQLKKYDQSNTYLSKFSYIISHDLKAPMRMIVSFAQLLYKTFSKEELKENQKEYLDFIINSVQELSLLVDDLSQFVSLEGSKVNLEKFNLQDLLEQITLQLQNKIEAKNATINFANIPSSFIADKTKSKLIFQNLISNAIKYSQKNIPPKINIECIEHSDKWEFKVKDNGIGIAAQYHQNIFEIFVKLHHDKKIDSSGVGLALVNKAVEKHQGNIKVKSKLGEGATFIFSMAKFGL